MEKVNEYRSEVLTHLKYIKEKVDANHKNINLINGRVRKNERSISWIKGIGLTLSIGISYLFRIFIKD